MLRFAGRAAMAALRPRSAAPAFESRAAMPRGNSLPFRSAFALTPAVPAHLLRRLSLGGRARPGDGVVAAIPTAVGLGAGGCRGCVSRGFAGSRGVSTGGRGRGSNGPNGGQGGREQGSAPSPSGKLTDLIKQSNSVSRLQYLVDKHVESFNQIHVSDAWVSLRKVRELGERGEAEALLQHLQEITGETVQEMEAWTVASIVRSMATLYACGRIMVVDDALAGKLLDRAEATAGDFSPQDVSKLVWALATMGIKPEAGLLEAMQRQAIATVRDFKPQNVANLVWALAKMGVEPEPGLLKAMQRRAMQMAGGFNPQAAANLVWALAEMRVRPDPGLLEAMEVRASRGRERER